MELKFYEIVLFFTINASLFHIQTAQTQIQNVSLTYDDTDFAFFKTTPDINQPNAQIQCINWGGNLATIKSAVEDSLLLYSIPDLDTTFTCHIGLNDIDSEAGTNGDYFVWIDGSTSSYRNWGTLANNFPVSTNGYDCVRHRYTSGGVLSQGWLNDPCSITRNCYFCSKPGTLNGCDLTYDSSCYKVFEVSNPINWLDAQSSCAIWGGDLTSITTERENNYLNTLITSSVGNCWIGLNDRDVEAMYTWIDGTTISYTNWTSTPSDDTNSNCVQINNAGNGIWESVSCDLTLNAFLCKRDPSSTIPTVAVEGTTYTYTSGVDRQNVLLLCAPLDGGSLDLMWDNTFTNPVNIYSEISQFQTEPTAFVCTRDTTIIVTTYISVIVPEISVKYYQFLSSTHTDTYPTTNEVSIPLSIQEVSLSTNLVGKWNIPGDTNTSSSTLDIGTFIEADTGLYTFYTNNWDGVEVIAMQITISSSEALTAMTPEEEFIFDDTRFGYFSDSPTTNWLNAQLRCISWGGNLATIKSKEEDSLLYYTTNIQTHYGCYIGLNDIRNEADNNASAFTWVDGSSSAYRNFQPGLPRSGSSSDIRDCVNFRFKITGNFLSEGWLEPVCSNSFNCHFCTKPATSGDCDLIYDSSCYKVFEVSTPINWLDAQSSCAIWGGDLTSITTERENNYLNTLITSSVGNCWIGLNDRDVEGMYTWIDGTTFTSPNFISVQSNDETNDCVEIDSNGNNWVLVDCDTATDKFLCERDSTVTTETRFIVLTNGVVLYRPLSSDIFLYDPTLTLVYGIGDFSGLVWRYATKYDLSDAMTISSSFNASEIEFTSLTIDNSMQGYYFYELNSVLSPIIGLYDDSITTVAVEGTTYTYISGVDRQNVLLLCAPMDGGSLDLIWDNTLTNPVNIYSEISQFQTEPTAFVCTRDTTTIVTTYISLIVPEISVKYYQLLSSSHTHTYPTTNEVSIPLSTQEVSLSTNIVGKWNIPEDTNTSSSTVDIGTFIEADTGLYTFYTNNWDGAEVIAMQITISSSPALSAMIPEEEFIFDDTKFGYFSDSPNNTDWLNAQLNCISWGGNLATIKSKEEDNLLYYTTDITTHYGCYIGLNDILNEADSNASAFTWVDGSSSAYRNFQPGLPRSGSSSDDRDCVIFRFMIGNVLSEGWLEPVCIYPFNCHFCTKPATSGDCDLIYDSSCYKVFEVSTPINWLDAQSSCAIWGGDLTSITTERENNYLNTLITSSVGNCWIGLNDRDVEGMYTWIDGTTFTQPSFVTTLSNNEANDCVQIINDAGWESVSCLSTLNSFICKASSVISTVERFGELINEGLNFQTISANTFLFNSLTLACGGEENDVISWKFSQNSDLRANEVITATYSGMGSGLSWLEVENTKQGYYQCQISSSSYTVGVYDISVTTVAVSGTTYTYLEGVDREDVLLLCDPTDSGTLSTLMWDDTYSNPLNLHSVRNSLPTEPTQFICSRGTTPIVSIFLSVTVPTLAVKYELFVVGSYPLIYPSINNLSIPLETQSVSLVMNVVGKWSTPDGTISTGSTFQISEFMTESVGVYTFYTNNWDDFEVGIQINIIAIPGIVAPVPTVSFIFDGTQFGYFTLPTESIDWVDSETSCMTWNGHLSTIRSQQEDTLLLHSIVSIEQIVCYIGLNDRETEAGTDASAFVWEDGSNSTYRQFGTNLGFTFPVGVNDGDDCVSFRYVINNIISNGWLNRGCDELRSCYFCNRPVASSDCDLIYDSSCYKVFEVSTPVNWLDAQSSCAIWGGDLTSITTERENNYLNTLITSSVGNCWIGLNDRDVEGMYTWIDGTTFTQPSFVTTSSNNEANDCVQIINDAGWESVSCLSTLNSFICKASSVISTVERFGELINGGLNFLTINANTFLFNSLTLACGGEEGTTISWTFSKISDFVTFEIITATSSSSETGLSWLEVDISKQGYYQCQIGGGIKYILGLYNQTITTVAISGSTYSYTVGIDRVDASLLCDPNDDSIYLGSLMWGIADGGTLTNPINMFEWSNTLDQQTYQLNCPSVGNEIITVIINIYIPTLTVSSTESSGQFSALYPANNTIPLKVRTEDLSLSANLPGRWRLPDDTYTDEQSIIYVSLDYQYFGLYQYLINNWDEIEIVAIQITLIPDGYVVTDPISISDAPIQNDSIIIATQEGSMIDCAVSSLNDNVQWTFISQTDSAVTDITSDAIFSEETGFSTLVVTANEPGYYSCIINTQSVYTFSVVDESSIVMVKSFDDPLQQINFTVDSPVSLLYYPSSSITQVSVTDSDIHWTNDVVVSGEDKLYLQEYPNPADLNSVFSNVGGGLQTFSCFYRMSPVALLGTLQIALKDTTTITVYYEGYSMTFSDVNNPVFPSAQEVPILAGTRYIVLTCNLPECVWKISNDPNVITIDSYIIPEISDTYSRTFSLLRMTSNDISYTTAHVHIYAPIVTTTQFPSTQPQSSSILVAVVIIVLMLIISLAVIAVLIPIFIYFYMKKRKTNKRPKPSVLTKDGYPGYENLSELHSPSKEYIDLPANSNPQYMTIDETSMIPLESENEQKHREYVNLKNESTYTSPYEQINERNMKTDIELNPIVPYERYVPMSPVKEEKKFVSKSIPTKEFPATYQEYVASGIEKDSLFLVEFTQLNEDARINAMFETDEASKVDNTPKNPFKNIIPFDENRIVLNSPYFDCNYINASYVNDYQFIATIHPTKETHRDFLQMIYQTEASMVIMLTTRKEKAKVISGISNRVCYWPKKDEPTNCEPFETTLITSTETNAFIKQEILLKNTSERKEHTFIHCISPTWNEDSTVADMTPTVALLNRILNQIKDDPSKPIIIHCQDGISKTGILLSGINSVKELTHKKSINIFNSVKNLRRQRMKMVPTLACYTTCYSLMNEYCSIHL